MRKINLLYIITKLELGGAQKQLLSLIKRLDREKFNLFLFTAKKGILLGEALSMEGLQVKPSFFLERPVNPLRDMAAFFEIYFFIRKNKIDIVHTHSSKAGIVGRLAARLAGVKTILHTVHGWPFHDYQSRIARRLFIRLERIAAGFSNRIVVVSASDWEKGLKNYIGTPDKYALIRYGIDYAEFNNPNGKIREEFKAGKDPLVGCISCLKPQKAPEDFIRTVQLVKEALPQAKFLLVGEGELRPRIESLIQRLKLEEAVTLTGWRRDIPRILSGVDVFVLSSLWEGLPVAVLEAMASGKPVVATDTGGVREVVREEETGFLVPAGRPDVLSGRLLNLLQNASLRKTMGERARAALGEDFRIEKMADEFTLLYEKLTN
ncbi:MAG: glycosyltransferase family 4 protein [Candidatus Omnitrophica bacterium]|nr:glycosyltransferase family 4 protein [Candidatus Omnitrophota bacterium]